MHADANPFDVHIGAFVDGPEIDLNSPPTMPVSGTATYFGPAAGLYAAEYGSDALSAPRGSLEVGEFGGGVTLSADFSSNTIAGRVDNISVSGVFWNSQTSETAAFSGVATDYRVNLGTTSINVGNGTFQGANVTLTSPSVPTAQSSGNWAGQFSNRPTSDGDPRLVAGTFGGAGATAGGSKVGFVGAFFGAKQ